MLMNGTCSTCSDKMMAIVFFKCCIIMMHRLLIFANKMDLYCNYYLEKSVRVHVWDEIQHALCFLFTLN